MHICSMWPTSRRPIIGIRCSWMRAFTSTPCISNPKIPTLSRGLPPSSSGPQLHGLKTGPVFRQGQDPQGPLKMKMELRKMMTWSMWWTSSFEEAESLGWDHLKLWTCIYFVFIAFGICLLSYCHRTWLYFIAFSFCLLSYCDGTLSLQACCRTIALWWFV